MDFDTKLSFFSGSFLTVAMTAPIYDIAMALLLGIVGGFAGMVGKLLFQKLFYRDKKQKGPQQQLRPNLRLNKTVKEKLWNKNLNTWK